jgi:hypothetical protein
MKCPKCGFNSFEYYDTCKKCSADLVGYKQTHSITSLVLPLEAKQALAAASRTVEREAEQIDSTVETHNDIFSFNLPDDVPATSVQPDDDPFNFDEPTSPAATMQTTVAKSADDDIFANLLESTSQTEDTPFAAATITAPPAAAPSESSVTGDFDLENFSWDETPAATTVQVTPDAAEPADDFDSLFGDTKDNSFK